MIYQAIVTKYFGPSNVRGSRIKAKAYARSITVSYNHALNVDDNHTAAAAALAAKMGWRGAWYGGGMPSQDGNVYVCVPSADRDGKDVAFYVGAEINSNTLIIKQWSAIGFSWRLLRWRHGLWHYLERDGKIVAEGKNAKALLSQGWYA